MTRIFAAALLMVSLLALAAPGDLDPGFSGDGLLSVHIGNFAYTTPIIQKSDGRLVLTGHGGALAAIRQGDGKIVLAGYAITSNGATDIALARFNTDGNLDPTFDGDGRATLDVGGTNEHAVGLALQPGGKLVVAGQSDAGGTNRAFLARYDVTGALDATFGDGGLAFVGVGSGLAFRVTDLAQQADGKLVVAGTAEGADRPKLGLVRVTTDGALDSSFHGDGLLLMEFEGGLAEASSVAIQSDGSVVISGYEPLSKKTTDVALLRFKAGGSADDSFGSVGKANIDSRKSGALFSLGVQTDGRLVAKGLIQGKGSVLEGDGSELVVAHMSADGELDTTHGVDFGAFSAARFHDNSAAPGRIGLVETLRYVAEEDASVSYAVRRTSGSAGVVSVDYATTAGTALPGSDFESTSGTLIWNDGDVDDKTIAIDLTDDPDPEVTKRFLLSLTSPTGGAVLAASAATTFIQNADGSGNLSFDPLANWIPHTEGTSNIRVGVYRSNGLEGKVSVSYTTTGAATRGEDFVISGTLAWADGEAGGKFIDVDYLEDAVVEGTESFDIELTAPTGGATISSSHGRQKMIIVDNDEGFFIHVSGASVNENGGSFQIAVTRSGASHGAASVDYSTVNGTAVAGSDYSSASGTLTWAAGDALEKSIEIAITDDQIDESNESFTVSLSNPTGGAGLGANSSASVTIVDNDSSPTLRGGGGGTTSLELLALLGLLSALARRKIQIRPQELRPRVL